MFFSKSSVLNLFLGLPKPIQYFCDTVPSNLSGRVECGNLLSVQS
jgi:hypothetical protein